MKAKNKFYQYMKVHYVKKSLLAISIVAFITSCSKVGDDHSTISSGGGGTPVDCSGPAKKFQADVIPIIQASCGSCHGAGSANGPGALTSYTEIFNARTLIRSAVVSGSMPQGGSLSPTEKSVIVCWIDNGAPNN